MRDLVRARAAVERHRLERAGLIGERRELPFPSAVLSDAWEPDLYSTFGHLPGLNVVLGKEER
jgi:hypothetical protein